MLAALKLSNWIHETDSHPLVCTEKNAAFQNSLIAAMTRAAVENNRSFRCTRGGGYDTCIKLHAPVADAIDTVRMMAELVMRDYTPPSDSRTVRSAAAAGSAAAAASLGICSLTARAFAANIARTKDAFDPSIYYMSRTTRLAVVADVLESHACTDMSHNDIPLLVLWLFSLVSPDLIRSNLKCWVPDDGWHEFGFTGQLAGLPGTRVPGISLAATADADPLDEMTIAYVLYYTAAKRLRMTPKTRLIDGLIDAFMYAGANECDIGAVLDSNESITVATCASPSLKRHHKRMKGSTENLILVLSRDLKQAVLEMKGSIPVSSDTMAAIRHGRSIGAYTTLPGGAAYIFGDKGRWTTYPIRAVDRASFIQEAMSYCLYSSVAELHRMDVGGKPIAYVRIGGCHHSSVVRTIKLTTTARDAGPIVAVSYQVKGVYTTLIALLSETWCAHQARAAAFYMEPREKLGGSSYAGMEATGNGYRFVRLSYYPVMMKLWYSTSYVCHVTALTIMRKWAGLTALFPSATTSCTDMPERIAALRSLLLQVVYPETPPKAGYVEYEIFLRPLLAIQEDIDDLTDPVIVGPTPTGWARCTRQASVWWKCLEHCTRNAKAPSLVWPASLEVKNAFVHPPADTRFFHNREGGFDILSAAHTASQKLHSKKASGMASDCLKDCALYCDQHPGAVSLLSFFVTALESRASFGSVDNTTGKAWRSVANPRDEPLQCLHGVSSQDCIRDSSYPIYALHGKHSVDYFHMDDRLFVQEIDFDEHTEASQRLVSCLEKYHTAVKLPTYRNWGRLAVPKRPVDRRVRPPVAAAAAAAAVDTKAPLPLPPPRPVAVVTETTTTTTTTTSFTSTSTSAPETVIYNPFKGIYAAAASAASAIPPIHIPPPPSRVDPFSGGRKRGMASADDIVPVKSILKKATNDGSPPKKARNVIFGETKESAPPPPPPPPPPPTMRMPPMSILSPLSPQGAGAHFNDDDDDDSNVFDFNQYGRHVRKD